MRPSDVFFKLFLFSLFCFASSRRSRWTTQPFPEDFVWGTSTSAFQIEGATSGYGRGQSHWDEFSRKAGTIEDNSTADVSADHYHHFLADIILLRQLGVSDEIEFLAFLLLFWVTSYRLSFSWPRLLPRGTIDEINAEGILFYDKLINALILNGIEPMVTLYHWDLPLALAHKGGWLNRETVDHFKRYAEFCFRHYGDRVKKWITINEPYIELNQGYCSRVQVFAPGFLQEHCTWTYYLGSYHLLLAHGSAARVYKRTFQSEQQGIIGISLFAAWYEPENRFNSVEQRGADLLIASGFDLFMQPIFGRGGGFPKMMKNTVGPRLPPLSPKEKKLLLGSADFLGINYYYTMLAREIQTKRTNLTQIEEDFGVEEIMKPSKYRPEPFHPDELVDVFNYILINYGNITVYVTENGCTDTPEEGLNDKSRIKYIRGHLKAVAKAISKGSDVRGYFVWSLMDNFEWSSGYKPKFGLFSVDFSDPMRSRTPKRSSKWFAKVTRNNRI